MKQKNMAWILFLAFSTFVWTSCNKDDNAPLALHLIENNTFELYYGAQGGVTIIGGDGTYSFSCNSPLLKAEMTHSNYILFKALGVGNALVTINDQSGNSYVLNVIVTYRTESFLVMRTEATVTGDNLTLGAQKELKEKALATIPVKIGGGYQFTYTEYADQDTTRGTVHVYPDAFGKESIEGSFEKIIVKASDGTYSYQLYRLRYQDTDHTFVQIPYQESPNRSIGFRAYQFAEDLKERFLPDYPEVEQVYTSQIITPASN